VTLGWQIYGANGDLLTSWSTAETYLTHGEGESASMARENLDDAPELLRAAAEDAAFEASKHICPWTNSATRRYFRCGSDEVRAGAKLARDGKWEDAKSLWETGTKDGSVSARGKAYLDLAVAYERDGKVGKALKNAEEAAKLLDKGWVDAYVVELRTRTKQQKRLKEQMERVQPPAGATPGNAPAPGK
jgi:hypothetical protein